MLSEKEEELCSEIEKLEKQFKNLKVNLLLEFKTMGKSVDEITAIISCIESDIRYYVYRSWKKMVKQKFENLEDLFNDLNVTVWNILDHYLLDYFVNDFGSEELKQSMEAYNSVLKIFKKRTLVLDFINCWKEAQRERDIPDSEKLTFKFVNPTMTLADLDKFREEFAAEHFPSFFHCSEAIMHYGRFQTGCFVVTFHVPKELASKIVMDKYQLFDDFSVVHAYIGDKKIYEKEDESKHAYMTITM